MKDGLLWMSNPQFTIALIVENGQITNAAPIAYGNVGMDVNEYLKKYRKLYDLVCWLPDEE